MDCDTSVRVTTSGMPTAVPLRPAKLERMSLRTPPDCPSTLGPLDPSPGYGPAVSEGIVLHVRGLDAIDGTPVLDVKPYMDEFAPRTPVRQPDWSRELMRGYFRSTR